MSLTTEQGRVPAFGVYGDTVRFVDYRDIYTRMQRIIPSLRLTALDRRNVHRESYCILLYLVHEASSLRIPMPVTVKKHESPDFELHFEDGSVRGVEVSEATTAEHQIWLREEAKKRIDYLDSSSSELNILHPSVNSGLVGDATQGHQQEATERWADAVSRCYTKKLDVARKYDYPHPLHLVLYSNTGQDVDDYGEAIKLLRRRVVKSPLFEKVFVLVGSTLLLRDVLGDYEPHYGYTEFDETENALEYLDRVAIFLGDRVPYSKWKWVWIALYETLYGFMICSLQGTAPDSVLQNVICPNKECGKSFWPGEIRDNEYRCPSCQKEFGQAFMERLIPFEEVVSRVQQARYMIQYTNSEVFVFAPEEAEAVRILRGLAEGLLQFVPKSWLIHLRGNEDLVSTVVSVIERLVSPEHNIVLSAEQKERMGGILVEIRSLLRSAGSKDFAS